MKSLNTKELQSVSGGTPEQDRALKAVTTQYTKAVNRYGANSLPAKFYHRVGNALISQGARW